MRDNLLVETQRLKTATACIKRKLSALKVSLEELGLSVDEVDARLEKVVDSSEIYKAKLIRENGREIKRLEKEVEDLNKKLCESTGQPQGTSLEVLKIASTMTVLESILLHICESAPDFQLMSYSFLFPAVVERVVRGDDGAYFIDEIPVSSSEVIRRGKEHLKWIRSECDTHVTDPESWDKYQGVVCDWWRNDALPMLYGSRDEQWDDDLPLSLVEMKSWQSDPSSRPIYFSGVFDAYEVYRKHKDEVYESCGARDFDLKHFSFTSNP